MSPIALGLTFYLLAISFGQGYECGNNATVCKCLKSLSENSKYKDDEIERNVTQDPTFQGVLQRLIAYGNESPECRGNDTFTLRALKFQDQAGNCHIYPSALDDLDDQSTYRTYHSLTDSVCRDQKNMMRTNATSSYCSAWFGRSLVWSGTDNRMLHFRDMASATYALAVILIIVFAILIKVGVDFMKEKRQYQEDVKAGKVIEESSTNSISYHPSEVT